MNPTKNIEEKKNIRLTSWSLDRFGSGKSLQLAGSTTYSAEEAPETATAFSKGSSSRSPPAVAEQRFQTRPAGRGFFLIDTIATGQNPLREGASASKSARNGPISSGSVNFRLLSWTSLRPVMFPPSRGQHEGKRLGGAGTAVTLRIAKAAQDSFRTEKSGGFRYPVPVAPADSSTIPRRIFSGRATIV
jgi:hypothetical protein